MLRRALPTDRRARATVRLIRRSGEVAPWSTAQDRAGDPQGVPVAGARLRARRRAGRAGRASARTRSGTRLRADRDGAGHRPGGARPRRAHARGRALHRLPRRAGDAARAQQVERRGAAAIPVVEADGRESQWTGADLRERIAFASIGLDLRLDAAALERELRRAIRPGIARADLQRLVVLNAKALMERDADYSRFAGRILLTYVYEETLGWDIVRDGVGALKAAHERALRRDAAPRREDRPDRPAAARVRPRAARRGRSIPTADLDFDFLGLQTLYDRYLIVDKTGARPRRIEAPQLFWLRVAMGVCLAEHEADRDARALDLYSALPAAALLLLDADAVQRRHAALAALVLLRLQDRGHAVVDRRARHRRERDVLEVGGRPRRLVDRGARHRLAHRVHQRRVPGRRAVPEDAQRPARRRQPGRQAGRARAARTSRSGTTTSASSSSCAATPATSAAARTT